MRLSINGWPPVASHIACLLLGVALTNLSMSDDPREEPVFPASHQAILNFKPNQVRMIDTRVGEPGFVARQETKSVCLLDLAKIRVKFGSKQLQVFGSLHAFPAIAAAANEAASGNLVIVGTKTAKNYRPCHNQPKVNYGSP